MGRYNVRGKNKGKEDIIVGTGTKMRPRLSTAYTRYQRTTTIEAVAMTTLAAIGTT